MKLWKLSRPVARVNYDEMYGLVIRAESADEARLMASKAAGDEGGAVWLDSQRSICFVLQNWGKPGIILSDFHAG